MRRMQLMRDLHRSREPSVRWRTRVRIEGESRSSRGIRGLEQEIRHSARVRKLLSHVLARYRPGTTRSVYYKWQGIHWVLASLADLGYPREDPGVEPLLDRALGLWLGPSYWQTFSAGSKAAANRHYGVPVVRGRARRCASQQGAALYYATQLGFPDVRSKQLCDLLRRWQWPDGGWNCDRDPEADTSSFMETLWPMRGLAAYAAEVGIPHAKQAARAASEVFLKRQLFRRRTNGNVMNPDFARLHYPLYWHYDILAGLKGMAEVGQVRDPRCSEALDWLESKELPGGGWPAEARYYKVSVGFRPNSEFVDWGGVSQRRRNDWVTTDALYVLNEAGRLTV